MAELQNVQVFHTLELMASYHPDFQLLLADHQVLLACRKLSSFRIGVRKHLCCSALKCKSADMQPCAWHQKLQPDKNQMLAQGDAAERIEHFITPADPERSLLSLISSQSVQKLGKSGLVSTSGKGQTCYKALVAGSGGLHLPQQRLRVLPFRYAPPADPLHGYVADHASAR